MHHRQQRLRTASEHGDRHISASRRNVPQLTGPGAQSAPECQICAPHLAVISGAVTVQLDDMHRAGLS
jgi:hypothetical protein